MEFEKKVEVQYLDGNKIMHTFNVLSSNARNKIFGDYLQIKALMGKQGDKEISPMEFIRDDKNIFDFMNSVLTAGCPTLDLDKIPPGEGDKLFNDLNAFILTGDLKN